MSTIRWTGNAPAVAQVNTITVGGAAALAQIYTVTINGKSVSYTALNTDTNTLIATGLYTALIASQIPEFLEITWTNPSAGVVLGTATTAGVVFTQTSSASGTGTLTTQAGIAQPVISSITDAAGTGTLAFNTTFYYKITALNPAGETTVSAEVSKTTANDAANTHTLTVNWSAPVGTGITGYRIYGRAASGSEALIATVGATATSFADAGTIAPSGSPPVANTTVSSGPNDVSCPLNYSTGLVPVTGDILIIENGNTTQSLLYNLSTLSGVTLAELHVRASFTGTIGLPKTAASGYAEYRPDYLAVGATLIYLGRGDGSGSGRVKINTGSVQTTIYMDGMGSPAESGLPAFIWKGTHASNLLFATKGSMGACIFGGEVATILTIDVAFQTNRSGDVTFSAQTGLTWTTLNQTGGQLTLFSAGTTQNVSGGTCTQKEGAITTLNLRDDRGSQPQYIANGAGTITTVNAAGKVTFDASQSQRAMTITNANCYGPVKWLDPFQRITYTNGILLSQTGLGMDDGPSINRGRNYTISFS